MKHIFAGAALTLAFLTIPVLAAAGTSAPPQPSAATSQSASAPQPTPTPVASTSESANPAWCRTGYVCRPILDMVRVDVSLIKLQRDLDDAKARNRRFHVDLACGPGVGAVPVSGGATTSFTTACIIGLALRLGK